MKNLSLLLMLSLVFAPAFTAATPGQQTADAIIEKHIAALGGREALSKLTSRKSSGTITISTPGGDLTGPVELWNKAPNKARAYTVLDLTPMGVSEKMILDQRFDGTKGWVLNTLQGDREMEAGQQASQKNNIFPTPFLTYKETGLAVTVLPSEKFGGKDAIVLQLTPKTGPSARLYLDPDTYLPLRTVAKILQPEVGEVEQVGEASDFRVVDGVKVAFTTVSTTPSQTVTIKLTKVEHNVAIDDAMFGGKVITPDHRRR